jgi:hypothetical protein
MAKIVYLEMADEDFDFITGFEPDRDRSANRAELVEILQEIREIVAESYIAEEWEVEDD